MFGKIKIETRQRHTPSHPTPTPTPSRTHKITKPSTNTHKTKFKPKRSLKGGEFRILNQILYTEDSKKAVQYFNDNPEYCKTYHQGFQEQTTSWTVNPLDLIIKMLLKRDTLERMKIVDLGCGEGRLEESLRESGCLIKSYDIMQLKPFVIVADISKLPIKSGCKDMAVFCLSLMGTNYIEFLLEAKRVLKVGGELIIAEVESRCGDWGKFEKMLEWLGLVLQSREVQKYFRLMVLRKEREVEFNATSEYRKTRQSLEEVSRESLQPCIYKRR